METLYRAVGWIIFAIIVALLVGNPEVTHAYGTNPVAMCRVTTDYVQVKHCAKYKRANPSMQVTCPTLDPTGSYFVQKDCRRVFSDMQTLAQCKRWSKWSKRKLRITKDRKGRTALQRYRYRCVKRRGFPQK